MMKAGLQLKLSQQLTLTPQLQQSLKLLLMSSLDLEQEIEQQLENNPMLERSSDDDSGDGDEPAPAAPGPADSAASDSDSADAVADPVADVERDLSGGDDFAWDGEFAGDWGSGVSNDEDDEEFDPTLRMVRSCSLREHLLAQVGEMALPRHDRLLLTMLIDDLDDDGLLERDLPELLDGLSAETLAELGWDEAALAAGGAAHDELHIALTRLQQLDPAGVGANNLASCLLLQLARWPVSSAGLVLAQKLVASCLDLLASKDYTKIKRQLKCDDSELKQAIAVIQQLSPRPGAAFGDSDTRYIVTDVIVKRSKSGWQVELNPAAQPKLRVNRLYADILQRHRGEAGSLASHLQEAKWLIKNVQQRAITILRVSRAIVARQQRFFEHGEVAMRPLVLRDIAEELELHESTISRVTTHKFMQTPRGIYEFKYFFGSHVDTDSGGECSATAIKALIKQLIAQEDGKKPLSDSVLADLLDQQGIQVARRTVAKYREALQIPPVSQRKTL